MKLTSRMLQSLIREEKNRLQEAVINQDIRTVKNPVTNKDEKVNVTALATQLAQNVFYNVSLIPNIASNAKRLAQGHQQPNNATSEESNMTGFPNRKDIDEACGDPEMLPDPTHHDEDHEGSMAKRQMFKTAEYAATIFDMLEDDEELPAWIQSKLTKVADYIGVVKHYLEYDKMVDHYPANRKEKWSDADHDKQEKIAKEIEKDNPGISKQKKMAFAGAQVNREKRKRARKKKK